MAKKRQKKQGGQQFLSDENYIRQRARTLKIGTCYVSDAITKAGEGTVIVSRLHTGGRKHRRVSRGCLLFRTEGLFLSSSHRGLRTNGYDGTLTHCVMLLAEVGNNTSSLEAVLEVLRQNNEFYDYHLGDVSTEMLVPVLYQLGQHRLDRLAEFMREEGLLTDFKYFVMEAVVQIALHQPERRSEIIAWFADLLRFASPRIPDRYSQAI